MQTRKFPFVGKLCQNVILRLGKKEFIDDVLNLRKKWQITIAPRENGEDYQIIRADESTDLSLEEFSLFFSNENLPDFKNKKLNDLLDKSFKILCPKKRGSDRPPISAILKNNISEFDNDITKLRIAYGLSEAHQRYLKSFVLYNYIVVHPHFLPSPVVLSHAKNQNKGILLNLEIYPETTIKDIQGLWPKIKKERQIILGYDPERQSRRKNLERDLHICALKNSGLTCKRIAEDYVNKESSWQPTTYQEISRIIKRYKNNKPRKKT